MIAKAENKRAFQPKALQTDIQAKHEEQKRQRQIKPSEAVPRYQLDFPYTDAETIMEASHLLLTYLRHSYNAADQSKIENFLKTFLPTFFGIDKDAFVAAMADVYADTPPNEEEDEALPNEDAATHRGRKGPIPKKDLRRGLLDPKASKKDRDSRAGSKESTPDVLSMDEDSSTPTDTQSERPGRFEPSESRWMEHPTNARQGAKYNEPFTRNYFSLYANQNIYCFMRMFGIVYERLSNLKSHEIHVRDDVHRSLSHKPANELRISDKNPTEFFDDTTPGANYYRQLLRLFEGSLERTVETSRTEDILRRFYIPCGWQMYNFDKTLQAVIKYASQMVVNDNKERNSDIITLFMSNRSQSQTTHVREIVYRKQVEKLVKDGDVYRIVYVSENLHV